MVSCEQKTKKKCKGHSQLEEIFGVIRKDNSRVNFNIRDNLNINHNSNDFYYMRLKNRQSYGIFAVFHAISTSRSALKIFS